MFSNIIRGPIDITKQKANGEELLEEAWISWLKYVRERYDCTWIDILEQLCSKYYHWQPPAEDGTIRRKTINQILFR